MKKHTRTMLAVGVLTISLVAATASVSAAPKWGGDDFHRGGFDRSAVHAAVEANDYTMLPAEAQAKISEDIFKTMVERKAIMDNHHQRLEDAVANNDFEAFLEARESHKKTMETHRNNFDDEHDHKHRHEMRGPKHEEPTTQELQERFSKMVTYYNENGELPKKMKGHMGRKSKGNVSGMRGNYHEKIQTVVDRIDDTQKLEAVLERVVVKIEKLETATMDESRKEKIMNLLQMIQEMIENKLS